MAWVIFSSEGVGSLVRKYGIVNANVYRTLLENHVMSSVRASPHQPVIFMHDNAPCHTAKLVKEYLEEEPRLKSDRNSLAHIW